MAPPIALFSPVPPAETGVADFTHLVFGSDARFQIYDSQTLSASEFLRLVRENIHSALVFCLGNSSHHVNTLRLMGELLGYPGGICKLFLHLHEPILGGLALAYRRAVLRFSESRSPQADGGIALELGAVGGGEQLLKTLMARTRIAGILVHSSRARELLEQTIGTQVSGQGAAIRVLPHPVLDALEPNSCPVSERGYDVGIFGILDDEHKATDLAIRVVLESHRMGLVKRAVLCGFNAQDYWQQNRLAQDPIFDIENAPSRTRMLEIMGQTRVALQLRTRDRGESSGVVPMLFARDTAIVVSNLGSVDDGDSAAVWKVDNSTVLSVFPQIFRQISTRAPGLVSENSRSMYTPASFREEFLSWVS